MEYPINFPRNLEEFKKFVGDHLFHLDMVDDEICQNIMDKIYQGDYAFSDLEIQVMRRITTIGDVCTCDTDHRIGPDNKTCALSGT